ncbi:MAG: DoxX family protein [candidate division WOR-3 bacterium]
MGNKIKDDLYFFLLRFLFGFMYFFVHGLPKIKGGPETWAKIGKATGYIGINVFPTFFGFMASISEFLGGLLLMLGLFIRPASFFIALTMIVAIFYHFGRGDSLLGASHAIENFIVILFIFLKGSDSFSLERKFKSFFTNRL